MAAPDVWLFGLLLAVLAAATPGPDEPVDAEAVAHATLTAFHA